MGKKGGEQPPRPWRPHDGSQESSYAGRPRSSWGYWPGAWSGERKAKKQDPQRYNDMVISAGVRARADSQPSSAMTEAVAPIGDKMRAIQKYLTQARKAEEKARKIREDQAYRDQQWDAWAKQMKSSYVKQRKQYEADSAKAAEDLQATLEAGQQAARNVELVVSGQLAPAAMPVTAEDTSWEDYLRVPEVPSHSEAFMQEAMAAVHRAGLSNVGPLTTSEAAPPTDAQAQALVKQLRPDILRQLLAMTSAPPISAETPLVPTSTDVKMSSVYTGAPPAPTADSGVGPFPPSSPHAGRLTPQPEAVTEQKTVGEKTYARTSPLHPGQRDPNVPRQPTHEAAPRPGIKEASKAAKAPVDGPPGTSLTMKLEQARAEAMGEML